MARSAGADSERTWEQLVDAARESLDAKGPKVMSLRAVAKRAGYRLSTLQYYFPSRDDLIEAVLGEAYGRLTNRVKRSRHALDEGAPLESVAPDLALDFLRISRGWRNLCRARMVTNLLGPRMSRASTNALREASAELNTADGPSPELTLALHSLSVLLLRYSAHSPEEMATLLEVAPEEAEALVEAHIHRLSVLLARDISDAPG